LRSTLRAWRAHLADDQHGLSTGALFLLVGMVYERRHTREISEFGGLWRVMPVFSVLFLIVTFSSIGLPGTNGFVGEFLILLGAFRGRTLFGVLGAAASSWPLSTCSGPISASSLVPPTSRPICR
jgi:NADH:ubiquinone oxidoreductase subunit 4 (subunit M)